MTEAGAGGTAVDTDAAPQHSLVPLQRLIARHLLAPETTIPTDNAKLKAYVSKPFLAGMPVARTITALHGHQLAMTFPRARWTPKGQPVCMIELL